MRSLLPMSALRASATRARASFDSERWRASSSRALRIRILEKWILARQAGQAKEFLRHFAEDPIPGPSIVRPLVSDLAASGASLIRFADSETAALCGKATWQMHRIAHRHREDLFSALFDYAADSPYRLAVSSLAMKSKDELESMGKWGVWRRLRALEVLARGVRTGEPQVYDAWAFKGVDGRVPEDPSPLWRESEAVVLLVNDRVAETLRRQNTFEGRSVFHVSVPEWEAYDRIDWAVDEIRALYRKSGLKPREVPILVGAGHAGKSAVIRLMHEHRALDLGALLGPKHEAGHKRGFRTMSMPHSS